MTDSFTADGTLARTEHRTRRVLVTGAAGRIGSYCKRRFRSVTKSRFTVLQIGRAGQGG